jgi:hypothetical protein
MLIATLPTVLSDESFRQSNNIFSQPEIEAARYNTGGQTPYTAKEILERLQKIAGHYGKTLYVDLEGRQTRVDLWTPFSQSCVTLNREFEIELPGMIYFRKAGWYEIVNADPLHRKIYFEPRTMPNEYYLGQGQSVHIVARRFEVKGYLGGRDHEYIRAAAELGINSFMLSFVETPEDLAELEESYGSSSTAQTTPKTILKIESQKGVGMIRRFRKLVRNNYRLMAARDDLFLGYYDRRGEFLSVLKSIVEIDPEAIVASRLLTGLERGREITLADIEDIYLMSQFGYKHFMFADELSSKIELAVKVWQRQIAPNLDI